MECFVCNGRGHVPNNSATYATFNRDPEQWRAFLASRGADDEAITRVFLLAQSSRGYDLALSIMHGLLNNEQGGNPVRNVSAWLTSSAIKTRQMHGID